MNLSELLGVSGASAENAIWLYTRLRECYELAANTADSAEARNLAHQRLHNLRRFGEGFPDTGLTDTGKSTQTSLSVIRETLSLEDERGSLNTPFPRQAEINALPESAEKLYLLALLSLRGDNGAQGCANALQYLEGALSLEPANIIYRTLAAALHEPMGDTLAMQRAMYDNIR
ncbi:MAG: hypothetical protein FWF10_09640 [Clostridiales bacterium]|nr:hypothetical protein [Clostridiales bacterium]